MKNKENWNDSQLRFLRWWRGEKTDRPLMWVVAHRDTPASPLEPERKPENPQEAHLSLEVRLPQMRNYIRTHCYLADAFPYIDLNLGPGSLACYLGCEPAFAYDTVWYNEFVKNWGDVPIAFNPENKWLRNHEDIIRQAQDKAQKEFFVSIPDIVENVDILSAMRGPQNFCYDLIDEPETVERLVKQIDDIYFSYYDIFYDIVKEPDGSSCYTAFNIWSPGKTGKVQCDFSAMMSPAQYDELVVPSLNKQCARLDYSIYHLDGPAAIRHVDSLMKVKALNAMQWTAGAGKPDGGSSLWYPIYEKVRAAGKSLWISLYDGEYTDWISSADRLIDAFGNTSVYLIFPEMSQQQAERLIDHAYDKWNR